MHSPQPPHAMASFGFSSVINLQEAQMYFMPAFGRAGSADVSMLAGQRNAVTVQQHCNQRSVMQHTNTTIAS
eukprot:m.10361 g.10361  ORF g.10361 m.10361 type:complete len:72 (-) comp5551_c0_seq1:197-412(-)